jgi:hypothetical protein
MFGYMSNKGLGFVIFWFWSVTLMAQYTLSDPLTRLGIGERIINGNAGLLSMGGPSFVAVDPQVFQMNNPATYAWVKETAFQTSVSALSSKVMQTESSGNFYGGNIGEIAMGFRKTGNPWGFALGLSDYSRVGYAVDMPFAINDSISGIKHQYGNGGFHQLGVGAARKFVLLKDSSKVVGHQVSLGLNLQYMFGMVSHSRDLEFLNTNVYNSRFAHELRINDVRWDFGAWYQFPLFGNNKSGNKRGLAVGNVGATFSPQASIRSFSNEFGINYYNFGGVPVTIDTGFSNMEVPMQLKIPMQWTVSAGLSYWMKNGGYWSIAYSQTQQDWTRVDNLSIGWEELGALRNYRAQTFSFEWMPQSPDRSQSFFGLMRYRMGWTAIQDYIITHDQQATKTIYSAGVSMPIRSSKSNTTIQLGYQWRERSISNNTPIRVQSHAVLLGVQLHPFERWFIQRKYD